MFKADDTQRYIAQLNSREKPGPIPAVRQMAARTASKGSNPRTGAAQNNLSKQFDQIDEGIKSQLNNDFLENIKNGNNHQSFQKALSRYTDHEKIKA